MTPQERATAGAVRSAHVAHFLPPDWARVAQLVSPALERTAPDATAPQLLVLVPDAGAAVGLARTLAALPAARGRRIVAATSAARAKRLLVGAPAHAVIGAPAALAPALAASALKLDQVATVVLAAADELEADDADLGAVLAEVPKGAARLLTALDATAGVETLIERQLHKARRVTEDTVAAVKSSANIRCLTVTGVPADAIPQVLDEVDAPTAVVLAGDAAEATMARQVLAALGHADGDPVAHVVETEVPANTALVIVLGVPTGTAWAQALSATPTQVVAIVAPRQRAALARLAGAPVPPFSAKGAVAKARAAEARMRAELRDVLAAGVPSREVLALEPLLAEHDGLEVAAAALRLVERARAVTDEAVKHAEARIRKEMKEAEAEKAAADRPPRPRGIRIDRSDLPRTFGDDRPRGPRGPRRDDFPLREPGGGRGAGPRGGKPGGFAPRGDRPRGPRRDDDRGPRGPRGPR